MTTSPKFPLHSQGEHPSPAELLLSTNQGGQLLALTMVWILLEAGTALTICVGGGVMHGPSNCSLLLLKWHSGYWKESKQWVELYSRLAYDTTETAPTFCSVSYYGLVLDGILVWHSWAWVMKLLMVNLQVHEELLGLHHCSSVDAATLSTMINDLLMKMEGCLDRLCCQWLGKFHVSVLLSESGSFVHCYSHALNLATSDVLKTLG